MPVYDIQTFRPVGWTGLPLEASSGAPAPVRGLPAGLPWMAIALGVGLLLLARRW